MERRLYSSSCDLRRRWGQGAGRQPRSHGGHMPTWRGVTTLWSWQCQGLICIPDSTKDPPAGSLPYLGPDSITTWCCRLRPQDLVLKGSSCQCPGNLCCQVIRDPHSGGLLSWNPGKEGGLCTAGKGVLKWTFLILDTVFNILFGNAK